MRKIILLVCFLTIFMSILPCKKAKNLHAITHKLVILINRVENNRIHNRDPIEAANVINDYKVIYDGLCEDCKTWAQDNTQPLIDQILIYYGLDF